REVMKKIFLALILTVAVAAGTVQTASARVLVSASFGVPFGGYYGSPGYYSCPAPVYNYGYRYGYAPPVVYAPAPVVVYRPPVYVAPPVVSFNFGYGGYGGYYGGYHHHHYYRHGYW